MSLGVLPGAKLSEAEVATKFGVSRQPVREALNLLSREGLVAIQPQKATRVRRFSSKKIVASRFKRLAIEIEVLKNACLYWSEVYRPGFERALETQRQAVQNNDTQNFHDLDEEFHRLLADAGQTPFAFDEIKSQKAYVDRICVLSLKNTDEMTNLVDDHHLIFDCVSRKDAAGAEEALRTHLARIETTIDTVRQANSDYFED